VLSDWRWHAIEGIIGENKPRSKESTSRRNLFLSQLALSRRRERGKKRRTNEKRTARRIGVPHAEFPSRKSPYPPTSILVPADRNEISICIREPRSRGGLWTPGKVNNDLKFSRRHLRWRQRLWIEGSRLRESTRELLSSINELFAI